MKHVTFAVPMAPFGVGDKCLVPDEKAAEMDAKGELLAVEPWPAPAARKPARATPKPERRAGLFDTRVAR